MKNLLIILVLFFNTQITFSQEKNNNDVHTFKIINEIKTTPVKSQGRSGTCWAFATTSFIETELLRLGFDEMDLSEMFTVRYKLMSMAKNYIRYHGKTNFGEGGQAHDLLNVVKEYGFVPEKTYTGKNIGLDIHNHGEMSAVLIGMLDGILKKKSGKLTPKWDDAIESVLDTYLGIPPQNFKYKNKKYTPVTFRKKTGFNADDYIEITSYTHKPFYERFILELPDNWSNGEYYNVPVNELIKIMDNAIKNGYSVCWDGDSGKDNFLRKEGYAVIPDEKSISGGPEKEKVITQEMRQKAFDNFDVTDDHLMHIVGIAKDQNGTKFYYTKNSWGTKNKKYNGYWYMSEQYVKLKTIAIMVHKESIPKEIREKLGV